MPPPPSRAITFITCVADPAKYARARASIEALSPLGAPLAIDPIDNVSGAHSAAAALNLGWSRAGGDVLVFCHEDVVFPRDWLSMLARSIDEVEAKGKPWGILGPMGRSGKRFFGHALGPDGVAAFHGPLPAEVETLDELCLVVPRSIPLRFDEALGGFHLYGVDLSIQAAEAGLGVFAIDAPVRHDSSTRHRPPEYHAVKRRLQRKWMFRRRRVGRSIGTTCGRIRFGIFEGWF